MGQVPIVAILAPVIGLAALLFWTIAGKRMMAANDRRYGEYRLGELAQRMGLHIVDGDPATNMMQVHTAHNMSGAKAVEGRGRVRNWLDNAHETHIRLQGAPYGRPTEFLFHMRSESRDRIAVTLVSKEFRCRLGLQLPADLPAFEILHRKGGVGMKAEPEWNLPRQSFGDPDLDAALRLTSTDTRLGPYLASAAAGLTAHKFVHIQGNGQVIQSLTTEPAVMYAMFELEETQRVLEQMADALAGPVNS